MRAPRDLRVFFALWPPDQIRNQLAAAADSIPLESGARRVPAGNLHLTLHFIGNIYRSQLDCLLAAAARVEGKRFAIDIDGQGFFDKPRVAWLGCRRTPRALQDLQENLGQNLRRCDYHPESRAYNPHLTVIRKCRGVASRSEFEPIHWPVDRFALVESRQTGTGVKYQLMESWPLI